MAVSEIKATKKVGDVDREATIAFDFGGSLEAAVEKFGAEVVYTNFTRSATITAQAAIRRMLEDGKSQAEIEAKMAAWAPGVALERTIDPLAAIQAKMKDMTAEEKNAYIEQIMSTLGA